MGDNTVHKHWYEKNPMCLSLEKHVMSKQFPDFSFELLDNGSAAWVGKIATPELHGEYHVLVVYDNNHPCCHEEFSSVKVYPICPDVDEMFDSETASNLRRWVWRDASDNKYMRLHTNKETLDDPRIIHTAASFLHKAVVWLKNYENAYK